jgi:hypothetical protein
MEPLFKRQLMTATSAAALMLLSQSAHAGTVASIIGAYDAQCGSCSLLNGTTLTNYVTSTGGSAFDTPSLYILNPTSSTMTSVTLTLTGYQDAANGGTGATFQNPGPGPAAKQVITLPTIGANTVYQLIWNGAPSGGSVGASTGINMFANDYDDTLGNAAGTGHTDSLGNTCGTGSGTLTTLCAFVGNFDVKFSALLGGVTPIAANFSPDNTQGGGNVAGTFVGWEGLDADGMSETKFNTHALTFPGTLAVITTGTQGRQSSVPEPGTLALLGAGLGALTLQRRRRKKPEGAA